MATIHYITGDATEPIGEGNKIIAHIVNDVGKWGAGFTASLSKRWPHLKSEYLKWWAGRTPLSFDLGQVQVIYMGGYIWVANLVGQHGVYSKANPEPINYTAVRKGLKGVEYYTRLPKSTVHMPRIGCGLARGKWELIEPIIREELCDKGIEVYVYGLPT